MAQGDKIFENICSLRGCGLRRGCGPYSVLLGAAGGAGRSSLRGGRVGLLDAPNDGDH